MKKAFALLVCVCVCVTQEHRKQTDPKNSKSLLTDIIMLAAVEQIAHTQNIYGR